MKSSTFDVLDDIHKPYVILDPWWWTIYSDKEIRDFFGPSVDVFKQGLILKWIIPKKTTTN